MDHETFFANVDAQQPAYLLLTQPDDQMATFVLDKDNSFFAGAGPSCRMILGGADVQPIHCMFWLNENGVLCVQDWNTGGKTLLNGSPLEAESELKPEDELTVGGNLIVPVLTREGHVRTVTRLADRFEVEALPSDRLNEVPTGIEPPTAAPEPPMPNDLPAAAEVSVSPASEAATTIAGANQADVTPFPDSEFVYDANSDWDDGETADQPVNGFTFAEGALEGASGPGAEGGYSETSTAEDAIEDNKMLRIEVEQLRFELSEREARLQMRDSTRDKVDSTQDGGDETLRLVNRLEELLVELQVSDDRMRELEELLRVSDQATQAEREERQQLESWVTEIEQRVCQREEESNAELGRVVEQLKTAQSRCEHAEIQLKQVLESKADSVDASGQELIRNFQIREDDLQKRLADLSAENESLRQASHGQPSEATATEEFKQMEQKLLDAQVAASRERAEMARQRAELQHLKDEVDNKLKSAKDLGSADLRVEAMRQHLREIHAQERLEQEEKRQRSLGGRISRLLNRVSG